MRPKDACDSSRPDQFLQCLMRHLDESVRRQLLLRSGDNYFSPSTTITFRLLGGGVAPARVCVLRSHIERRFGAVGMWESRLPWARFPRDSWKEGEVALGFPRFPQARHFHSSLSRGFLVRCRPRAHSSSPWLSAC
jgi:hypothetical protein